MPKISKNSLRIPLLAPISVIFLSLLVVFFLNSEKQPAFTPSETYDLRDQKAVFQGRELVSPQEPSLALASSKKVLGESTGKKFIVVDLNKQTLYAYEGSKLIYEFLISSGKWNRTPTGVFRIWSKFRYTKMEGGNPLWNTYYYLPNVPYVMFFENEEVPGSRGFSLHGTYWHNNFGQPMSHGCVNMKTEEVALIYDWADPQLGDKKSIRATEDNPGTEIIIYGEAPKE